MPSRHLDKARRIYGRELMKLLPGKILPCGAHLFCITGDNFKVGQLFQRIFPGYSDITPRVPIKKSKCLQDNRYGRIETGAAYMHPFPDFNCSLVKWVPRQCQGIPSHKATGPEETGSGRSQTCRIASRTRSAILRPERRAVSRNAFKSSSGKYICVLTIYVIIGTLLTYIKCGDSPRPGTRSAAQRWCHSRSIPRNMDRNDSKSNRNKVT